MLNFKENKDLRKKIHDDKTIYKTNQNEKRIYKKKVKQSNNCGLMT